MTTTVRRRYVVRFDRSWYVLDTQTGRMWPGLVRVAAVQLADRMNRATPTA